MSKRIGVLIGRFEGYHNEHHDHVRRAALENDVVIILLGSSNRRVSIKNPLTVKQREELISENIWADYEIPPSVRFVFKPLPDDPLDNDAWAEMVRMNVNSQARWEDTITLYGSDKDESTFYLKMFPEWKQGITPAKSSMDATTLRKAWFDGYQTDLLLNKMHKEVPYATIQYLNSLPFNMDLQQEWKYYQDEALRFSGYPYKETLNFSCADAIVRWRDYFLFIIRARVPGKGCKATPGGFKNRDETFQQAAIREFYEECRPNIPPDALEKCIKATKLFDDPHRAMGIPRSTLGVYFDITDMFDDFPEIYPADDAAGYEWVHQQRLDDIAAETYDDHIFMVKHFVKVEKELQQLDNLLLGM